MISILFPAFYVIAIWWFTTGAILWLGRQDERYHSITLAFATALAGAGFLLLYLLKDDPTLLAAYAAFTAAVVIWGWLELAFIYGRVTGSRKTACPQGIKEGRRFVCAVEAILYHELSLIAALGTIAVITVTGINTVAFITFLVLWLMRISAKLNLFFGVPHVAFEMMPKRLAYLGSYFRTGELSLFFPFSVTAATLGFGYLAYSWYMTPLADAAAIITIPATLLALAIFEHWLLVTSFDETSLWAGFLGNRPKEASVRAVTMASQDLE